MISCAYIREMARYNRWQNRNIFAAATTLTDEQRCADRGAFFKSIHGTLSHLFWGDCMWMHRFSGSPAPDCTLASSAGFRTDWRSLSTERAAMDEAIIVWADNLSPQWLEGDLRWFSSAAGREIVRSKALLAMHFFNHQTHHRGQVHALLTGLGARPNDTDLMLMPAES